MRRAGYRAILTLVVSIQILGSAKSQEIDRSILNTESGLQDDFVYTMRFDHAGLLWGGTSAGLFSYNGREISSYSTTDGLADNFVTSLSPTYDEKGLWIGHYSGKISFFNGHSFQSNRWSQLDQPILTVLSAKSETWAVSRTGEFIRVSDSTSTPVAVDGAPNDYIRFAFLVSDDRAIIAGRNGLHMIDLSTADALAAHSLFQGNINALCQIEDEAIMFRADSQLYRMETGANDPRAIPVDGFRFTQSSAWQAIHSNANELWISDDEVVLSFNYVPKTNTIQLIGKLDGESGLPSAAIEVIETDRDGNLWVAARGAGVLQFKRPYAYSFSETNQPFLNDINICALDTKGNLLIGTNSGLFRVINKNLGQQLKLESIESLLEGVSVTAICELNTGQYWFGTSKGQLYMMDSSKIDRVNIAQIPDKINHVSVDNDGNIWAAYSTLGAEVYNQKGELIRTLNTSNGLSHNFIRSIFHDNTGTHWFALYGSKLTALSGDKFEYYGKNNGLNSFDFSGIQQDDLGAIWITTNDAGTYKLSKGQFSQVDFGDEKITAQLRSLWLSNGQIIVLTRDGVYHADQLTPSAGTYQSYSALKDANINDAGARLTESGDLFIPTSNGFFLATNYRKNEPVDPSVHVKSILIGEFNNPENGAVFESSTKRYAFSFDAIDYSNSRPVYFWYKLNGYDTNWVGPTSEAVANYMNLPPGDYSMEVKGGHNQWRVGDELAALRFTVSPPFWQSWWFILLISMSFVLISYGLVIIRTKSLEASNKRLESIITERTEQLRKQNKDIRQFAYTISHDLKAPANNIIALLSMVRAQKLIKKEGNEIIQMLSETGENMRGSLERLMKLVKEYETESARTSEVSIPDLIKEIQTNVHSLILESGASFRFSLNEKTISYHRGDLTSVLHNLMTNAMKYRDEARPLVIEISCVKEGDYIKLSVKDNGLGINLAKDGEKLFAPFKRIHTNAEGSGVGLSLMRSMIQKHGGRVEVESASGVGSIFHVYLRPKTS